MPTPCSEHYTFDLGVYCIQKSKAAHITMTCPHLIVYLIVGALPQTRSIERGRYSHRVFQKHVPEIGAHKMDDLLLILVRDDMFGHEDLEEVDLFAVGVDLFNLFQYLGTHPEELAGAGKVDHRRRYWHDDPSRGKNRIDGKEPQRRRAVEDDDVLVYRRFLDGLPEDQPEGEILLPLCP